MITPPFIKSGSKIRIVSPAGKVNEKYILPATEWLGNQGYRVEFGKHVFAQYFQFAGTDEQRFEDLQNALDDSETDVILFSRGGYGTVRIINQLDFTKFLLKPKWLAGFSDITVLHSYLNKLGVATIHAAMPRHFFENDGKISENLDSLIQLLSGKTSNYSFSISESNRFGNVTGELVGGNLSIVTSLLGTKFELDTDGKILFLEDINEFLYRVDRMMHQLKLAGKLDNLAGLIVGDLTDIQDNELPFGKTVQEIILDSVQEFNFPVAFGFPAGHEKKNLALTFGKIWQLNVNEKKVNLKLI